MSLMSWLKPSHSIFNSASPVSEFFNLQTRSPMLRCLQQLVGLPELDGLHADALRAQRVNESIFDALLRTMGVTYDVAALDLARIPRHGGVIVVANHPFGMIEGVIMNALLQRVRPDARVLANSLLGRYSEVAKSLILVDPFGGDAAPVSNRHGLRESLAWLKHGGILGAFPAGEVASLQLRKRQVSDPPWSKSIMRLAALANVPVLPMFFAGRNHASFQAAGLIHSRLRTVLLVREFLNKKGRSISIRIGNLISQQKLSELNSDLERIGYVRRKTYMLANRQPAKPYTPIRSLPFVIVDHGRRTQPETTRPIKIVEATDPVLIQQDISALPASALLCQQGENAVYIGRANELPNVVREIGRLRELTFRNTGEGTGRAIDLDEFDSYYLHLFIWNRKNCEIVGAYRIGQSDIILREIGCRGLYTSTLFSYRRRFLETTNPALEMGRSFVRIEYQRTYTPLLLLWRGIGAFVCRNPQYRTLFGPVSISNDYHPSSRQLIVNFLKEYCRADDLARLVRARSPFRIRPLRAWDHHAPADFTWDIEELSAFVADIETDQKGVPVLLRQYLKLGGKLVAFNVDHSFSNALDGLIVIDLLKTDHRLVERYLGVDGAASFVAYHHNKTAVVDTAVLAR